MKNEQEHKKGAPPGNPSRMPETHPAAEPDFKNVQKSDDGALSDNADKNAAQQSAKDDALKTEEEQSRH